MPRQAVQVTLAPKVLSWARTSAGWNVKEVAERLQVDPAEVEAWEAGAAPVSLSKLESLANYYKRPVAAFFLPRPPQIPPLPPDLRQLPGRQGVFSKETWLALRRARRLQVIAGDLMDALEQPTHALAAKATLADDPEKVAVQERDRLGVGIAKQKTWKDEREALWMWREAFERANILTFQLQMPVDDTRGFSFAELQPPAVVVSSEDSVHARIFTLLHEYGHIMLMSPGVCRPQEQAIPTRPSGIERWCDHFAGAALMPGDVLTTDADCLAFVKDVPDKARRLSQLSRTYKVSRLAVLTRLLTLALLSRDRYAEEVTALYTGPRKTGGGFAHPAARCVAEKGRTFTSLVFQALEQNVVGYSEMADYLGIRLKHLQRVRTLLTV